jgi:hypothetical protein
MQEKPAEKMDELFKLTDVRGELDKIKKTENRYEFPRPTTPPNLLEG